MSNIQAWIVGAALCLAGGALFSTNMVASVGLTVAGGALLWRAKFK